MKFKSKQASGCAIFSIAAARETFKSLFKCDLTLVVKIKLLRLAVFFMMPQFCGSLQGFALFHISLSLVAAKVHKSTIKKNQCPTF